jgi:hypothetical protein
VISYAPRHAEQDIPERPVRGGMEASRTPPPGLQAARTAAEASQPTRLPQRRLLRPKERLPMAHAPPRLPSLEDGVPLLQSLAHRWHLAERLHRAIRRRLREHLGRDPEPSAGVSWIRSRPRQPGWAASRGASTAARRYAVGSVTPAGGHRRARGRGQGTQREGPRPGRHQAPARTGSFAAGAPFVPVWVDAGYRGRGKEWAEQALGVKVEEVVNRSPKPPPEKVLGVWAKEW